MPAIHIPRSRIESALSLLHSKATREEDVDDAELVLCTGVSENQFERWHSKFEGKAWGFKVRYHDCCIIADELVSLPHGDAVASLLLRIGTQDMTNLKYSVEHNCRNPLTGARVESDLLIKVKGNFNGGNLGGNYGNSYPVAVIEVGVAQSFPDLHRKLGNFYQQIPSIEYYVAMKRYSNRSMVAAVFQRGVNNWAPTSVISFGQVKPHGNALTFFRQQGWVQPTGVGFGNWQPCTAPGLPQYQIILTAQALYARRQGGIPVGAPGQLNIDLFHAYTELVQNP